MRWSARRGAPTSSAPRSARPTSSSSTPTAQQIGGLDIAVTRDLNGLRAAIKQALPNADIQVEGLGDGVVLSGSVSSPIEAQTAFDIASRLVDDGKKVVNSITIHGRDQVMLKVTVAEVQRDVIKQLGIDLSGSLGYGTAVVNFNTTNPFTAFGQASDLGFGNTRSPAFQGR